MSISIKTESGIITVANVGGSGGSGSASIEYGTTEEFEEWSQTAKVGESFYVTDDYDDHPELIDYCTDIVEFDSASTYKGSPKIKFQKYGHIVIVDEICSWNDTVKNTTNSWTKVCSIPTKYVPSQIVNILGFKDGTSTPIAFNINSTNIQINGWTNYGENYYPHLHAVYYTNNTDF